MVDGNVDERENLELLVNLPGMSCQVVRSACVMLALMLLPAARKVLRKTTKLRTSTRSLKKMNLTQLLLSHALHAARW